MVTVAEVMTKSVVTLSPDDSLADAAATLASLGVSGAPVCDGAQRVVGVFSKSDVVDRLIDAKVDASSRVGDHMSTKLVSLRPSDTVATAVELMADRSIHRVVVLDDGGKLVGILAPLDVLKAVRGGALKLT